jgi:hypothetical protein
MPLRGAGLPSHAGIARRHLKASLADCVGATVGAYSQAILPVLQHSSTSAPKTRDLDATEETVYEYALYSNTGCM